MNRAVLSAGDIFLPMRVRMLPAHGGQTSGIGGTQNLPQFIHIQQEDGIPHVFRPFMIDIVANSPEDILRQFGMTVRSGELPVI